MNFLLIRRAGPLVPLLCTLFVTTAHAQWTLDDDRSTVQFMSLKNGTIAELHHFKSMSGTLAPDGMAEVVLELDSVETLIPIRNERMRKMLFETAEFPTATLTAQVPDAVAGLGVGQTQRLTTAVKVAMHGAEVAYSAELQVTRLADEGLMVSLVAPLLIKAADFDLEGGIRALREIAGLDSISPTVPVSAQLLFTMGSGVQYGD